MAVRPVLSLLVPATGFEIGRLPTKNRLVPRRLLVQDLKSDDFDCPGTFSRLFGSPPFCFEKGSFSCFRIVSKNCKSLYLFSNSENYASNFGRGKKLSPDQKGESGKGCASGGYMILLYSSAGKCPLDDGDIGNSGSGGDDDDDDDAGGTRKKRERAERNDKKRRE